MAPLESLMTPGSSKEIPGASASGYTPCDTTLLTARVSRLLVGRQSVPRPAAQFVGNFVNR